MRVVKSWLSQSDSKGREKRKFFFVFKCVKMGFDAEIDNEEGSSIVENLKDEIICSICLFIFEVEIVQVCFIILFSRRIL